METYRGDVLLLHGGSHGAWCWEEVLRELERAGCRGHAPDLPGAGADPTPRASVTFESCLAAATAFIESEGIEEFVLVGHSLAGILLPELAAAHPG
ncbi:MAG TPA: alpha/beta fold hydrolase, partial [bacterium]|nr:alpha/beta fold hydrolase [bacterium]